MPIAFFDFDRTLIRRNSAAMWVRFEVAGGHVSKWQGLRAAAWLTSYHLGYARLEDAIRDSITTLRGLAERDVVERTRRFYDELVRPLYRPGARAALVMHRRAGHRLVLLTSSSQYLSELAARDLELDDVLCTRFAVDEAGLFTGGIEGPLCFGPGKLAQAQRYARERGLPLAQCTYYGDSTSDLPVLEAVGRPVAVNPDPRLRRFARRRAWPIVDWG